MPESIPVADEDADDERADVSITLSPLLLNVHQLGAMLGGISQRKVRAMVSSGQIPRPLKIGRLSRWRRADVERWVVGLAA
ncbi:MAG TPA: helix-turn-helix domain-containing protein [Tepidisphaeraceae bacterium]|nr:helix-turn-helix domain-containing protein [Tepidisphaeraceae bacterium]